MPSLIQINVTANSGSTGRIAEGIGIQAINNGWNSYIAYGQYAIESKSSLLKIGSSLTVWEHGLETRLLDNQGLSSRCVTNHFLHQLESINPDVIHLHNIHGYYINYQILFKWLSIHSIPIVWTLHDCWPFTGHCSHFDFIGCNKWKTGCGNCPGLSVYPKSYLDRSARNYRLKKESITTVSKRLTLVPVSKWIGSFVNESFLRDADIKTIHNGIDINLFSPRKVSSLRTKFSIGNKKVVLGVAFPWTQRKGFDDMICLSGLLPVEEFKVIMVGLSDSQLRLLPQTIIGIKKTNNAKELADLYSLATVFANPTYEDNFPTVNIESLSCGTPVITYNTGGCPEAIDESTGIVVQRGDIKGLANAIMSIDKSKYTANCRNRAIRLFDKDKCFAEYIKLYDSLLG